VSNSSLRSAAAAGLVGSQDELGALGVVVAGLGMGLVTVGRAGRFGERAWRTVGAEMG
jgi:hypothetical protein